MKLKEIKRYEIIEIEEILKKPGLEIEQDEENWGIDFITINFDVVGHEPIKVEFTFLINGEEKKYNFDYYSIQKTIHFSESKTEYYFINCRSDYEVDGLWFDGVNVIVDENGVIAELNQTANNNYIQFKLKDIKIEFISETEKLFQRS